eukprot:364443-Chlamydomonas_euryale.AAC.15
MCSGMGGAGDTRPSLTASRAPRMDLQGWQYGTRSLRLLQVCQTAAWNRLVVVSAPEAVGTWSDYELKLHRAEPTWAWLR